MATAFISYSWDSDDHKAWVRRFAGDLKARGITVWLDQFDLRLGGDVTRFMEQRVSGADYVILVCTEAFGEKANERRGGVGYEQAIVTSEILDSSPTQGRFVCILRQGAPSRAIPAYMQSRLWLDCRDDSVYATALDQIAVHILGGRVVSTTTGSTAPVDCASEATAGVASGVPDTWVLVAGTGARRGFTAELESLSRMLGQRLVSARCGLVTGGWPGVDEWVARSFSDAAHAQSIPLEDALTQVVVRTELPAFAAGQLVFVEKGTAEWDEAIHRADVVILLGGLGATKKTGRRALGARKLVLPIAESGGDAKAMYIEMLREWRSLSWMGVAEKEFQRLGRPVPASVDAAIELVRKAQSATQHRSASNSDLGAVA